MERCTVYGLRESGSDEVRYVGQTRKDLQTRLKWHWCDARAGGRTKRANWMRSTQRKGSSIEIFALEKGAEMNASEVRWISYLKGCGERLLNMTDGGDEGVLLCGSENVQAKLDDESALEIYKSPERGDALAERFGVSKATVSQIRSGRTWSHVTKYLKRHKDRRSNLYRFFDGESPKQEAHDIARRYKKGEPMDALAEAYSTTRTTISRTLKAMGVEPRPCGLKKRPLRIDGEEYPGVLAAMKGAGRSHGYVMKHADFQEQT